MADMPKPTDPKAPIQPPKVATPAAAAPAKSGSAIGKLFKLGLCAVTLFVAGSMYWHGRQGRLAVGVVEVRLGQLGDLHPRHGRGRDRGREGQDPGGP